ncbi:hypothetical protein N8467_01020 [bacterium]|nr:hypothetical protein [bacterium]
MKITKQLLKEMIQKEMANPISENASSSAGHMSKYERIMSTLQGAPYKSIAIMSGQNPMASSSTASNPEAVGIRNDRLKKSLESRLSEEGLKFERIGGNFYGLDEQSVLIYNPNQEPTPEGHYGFLHKIAALNREFQQWGFVGGERITDPGNSSMVFTLYKIDYSVDDPRAYAPHGKHPATGIVHDDAAMQNMGGDYSYDPTSGKKFGISLEEQIGKKIVDLQEQVKSTNSTLKKRELRYKIQTLRELQGEK